MAWYAEQVGPLPLGVWLAAIAGGVGVAAYGRRGAKPDEAMLSGDELSPSPLGRTQGIAGAIPLAGTNASTSTLGYQAAATNEEWVTMASRALFLAGFSPLLVTGALVRYLRGEALSPTEAQAVEAALRLVGPPPVPAEPRVTSEPAPAAPQAPQAVPVPAPTPMAPAAAPMVGETLPGWPTPPPGKTSVPIVVDGTVIGVSYVAIPGYTPSGREGVRRRVLRR